MQFGLHSVNLHTCGYPDTMARLARAAEAAGFESLWVADHVVLPDPPMPQHPMTPDMRLLDPIVALTFVAAHTTRIRLGTGVIVLPQRNPLVLAKQLATLDVLSNGRMRLGVGIGWNEVEYVALNEDFGNRGRRSAEQVELLKRLWTEPSLSFESGWHHIDAAGIRPLPVQRRRIVR